MKILIVDYCVDCIGGVERTICTLANSLSDNNEVIVLSENRLSTEPFYEYSVDVKKEYLFDFAKGRKSVKTLNTIQRIYRKVMLPLKIKRYLRQHVDVDVVIFGRVYIALQFLLRARNIFTHMPKIIVRDAIHIYDFDKKDRRLLRDLFPRYVDYFIVSSDESRKTYESFFGSGKIKMIKVYNPIGIDPVVKYSPFAKSVVSIGRMDDNQKGFDTLIRAFVLVHEMYPDWKLKLYGDGHIKNELVELIERLSASSYIEIHNPTKNVVKVFNESSIFVLASRYEGYANILVEALACGIPSISLNWLMGVEEIIKDGKNGVVVRLENRMKYMSSSASDKDIENLCNAIMQFIKDPAFAERCGITGSKITETRSLELIIDEWRKIIE